MCIVIYTKTLELSAGYNTSPIIYDIPFKKRRNSMHWIIFVFRIYSGHSEIMYNKI